MEGRLRGGQCHDALVHLCSRLHAKRHLLTWRQLGAVAGQRAAIHTQTLIEQVGEWWTQRQRSTAQRARR
jgi:hypothetical protein